MLIEVLCDSERVSLQRAVRPAHASDSYTYVRETWCDGRVGVVLPFRLRAQRVELLLHGELVPCWGEQHELTGISGGWTHGDDEACGATVVRELQQTCGYDVSKDQLVYLGVAHGAKSTDTLHHLYVVDLTEYKQRDVTCASLGDDRSPTLPLWVHDGDILLCSDPHVHVAYNRFIEWLVREVARGDKS